MKTGNVSLNSMTFSQTKSLRENKQADKKESTRAISEKVDLSTNGVSVTSHAVPSYEEALELLQGIDFQQMNNVEWLSKSGTTQLMELL